MVQTTAKQGFIKCLGLCSFLLSIWAFVFGKYVENMNIILVGNLLLYLAGVFFCLEKVRRRAIVLFFYVTFFVFLLSRPTISMLKGNVWWYYGLEAANFSLNIIFVSLISLYIGCVICDKILSEKGYFKKEHTANFFDYSKIRTDNNLSLYYVSGLGYYICLVSSLIISAEKMMYMANREYADIYTGYTSSLPFFINALSVLMPYFLCIYLATLPKKSLSYLALGSYVLSTIPTLIIGARNSTVLALLFAWIYFILRDYLNGTKIWIGKFERICVIIVLPAAIAFLGYYNYSREGLEFAGEGIFSIIIDFFYKQGVTFDVMNRAYDAIPNLPDEVAKCYTFGGIIDYLGHNMFSRMLFGAISLGDGNNIIKAVYGNSFAHSLAYVAEPNYLSGHGMGSSYILETFVDFGYIGVSVFSFMLSVFMINAFQWFKNGRMQRIIILNALISFFLLPRAEATGWLNFMVYVQFWFVLVFCYVVAAMFEKDSTPQSAIYYKSKGMMINV